MDFYCCTAYICTWSLFYLCSKLQCCSGWGFSSVCVVLVGIVHDGLHVVSWEESGDAVADAFEPAVIVLLDYVDDGAFHEGQLVLFVLGVVVDGHNWEEGKESESEGVKERRRAEDRVFPQLLTFL